MSTNDSEKREQFGNRYLTDNKNVFQHNAWDNVVWDEEQENLAREKVSLNTTTYLSEDEGKQLEESSSIHWNDFYNQHNNRFFKDRHWLFTEFPELDNPDSETESKVVFEVGCGVGNTVFPILQANKNIFVHCCDLSDVAINIVKNEKLYDSMRCNAFTCDITNDDHAIHIDEASVDVISMIFVLSAIQPHKFIKTVNRLSVFLKPGGMFIFRDYGRYDLAQLRFKDGKCISDNFYMRGDKTRVYFFTQEELRDIFVKGCNLIEEQNLADRRLIVNRGRQIKMYRVWLQAKYRKKESL